MPMSLTEIVQQLHVRSYQKSSPGLEANDHMDRYRSCWVLALGRVY